MSASIFEQRAARIKGLRELADLLESTPELPFGHPTLQLSVHAILLPGVKTQDDAFVELRRIAFLLGVEADLRDEPHAYHPHARLELAGGVVYEASYVTDAYKRGYKPIEPESTSDSAASVATALLES
jgi:hypothetical protein